MQSLPRRTSVVIVGAGISGLVAARELVRGGVADVLVLEASDHVGGRVDQLGVTGGGHVLIKGGEFTCPAQKQLLALAADLGIEEERPLPTFADPESMGMFVRISDGVRHLEPFPLANDPEALDVYVAGRAALEELSRAVPADAPWDARDAAHLDSQTIAAWMQEHMPNATARDIFSWELSAFVDPREGSLLYLLGFLSAWGGWDEYFTDLGRFVGGSVQIARRLADQLDGRVSLSTPVRRIEHADGEVVVHADRGTVSADAVVLAMDPAQSATITFEPALPEARRRLQARWQPMHGTKIFAVYDRPWWREEGLAGLAFGPPPITQVLDVSPAEGEGILLLAIMETTATLAEFPDVVMNETAMRDAALDALEAFFGPKGRQVTELHLGVWHGDPWTAGCVSTTPPGTISTVGRTLREPIGRVVFAGAESGRMDFMDGAVTAGQRAARESRQLVAAERRP